MKKTALCTVSKIGRVALVATAICASSSSFAAALDLAGVDRTVTDVADLASYDGGVTNSSATLATLTFDISTDQTYSGVLGGKLKLVKSGTGTLTLSTVTRTYTGGTLVSAGGKLKLGGSVNKAQLGTGNVTIENGAAIDFNGCVSHTSVTAENFLPAVYAEGTGTDGTGAILNTGTQFANAGINNVYLTGDLLIYAKSRMNFYTVHTQGHTLRYTGASQSAFATIDNSQGGDVSIESGQYTAWVSNNCLGNTPSKGKVYLRGGKLTFWGSLTTPMDVVVESAGKMSQGSNGHNGTFTGTVTLNANVTLEVNNGLVFKNKVIAPTTTRSMTISQATTVASFEDCLVTNVAISANLGTMNLKRGATLITPTHQFVLCNVSASNNTITKLNIAAGSDATVRNFVVGNGGNNTKTGIVNQVSGTFRTVGCYNGETEVNERDGIRLGHYPNTHSEWNISGGELIVEGDSHILSLAANGRGELNISGGEVTTPTLRVNGRSTSTGYGVLKMTGGVLNLGAGGLTRRSGNRYAVTLGGGTIRATAVGGFTSPLNMTLTGSSGTNVTFDTQAANVTLSGVLSGAGGLHKAGSGTLTLSGADTYSGATTVKGGTVAFTSAYPGGDLEIDAATLSGASSPIVTASSLAFSSGKGIRILNADTLNTATFLGTKSLAASTAQIDTLPTLTLVASNGTTIADTSKWHYRLSADSRSIKFGPIAG